MQALYMYDFTQCFGKLSKIVLWSKRVTWWIYQHLLFVNLSLYRWLNWSLPEMYHSGYIVVLKMRHLIEKVLTGTVFAEMIKNAAN